MKITEIIFSVSFIMVLFGCNSDEVSCATTGINGEWIWTESTGGLGGWTYTPQTDGITKKLIIDDFFYKEYINDSLIIEIEYDLRISDEPLIGTKEKTFIQLDSGNKQAVIISETELEFIDQCFDCFNHYYIRN